MTARHEILDTDAHRWVKQPDIINGVKKTINIVLGPANHRRFEIQTKPTSTVIFQFESESSSHNGKAHYSDRYNMKSIKRLRKGEVYQFNFKTGTQGKRTGFRITHI